MVPSEAAPSRALGEEEPALGDGDLQKVIAVGSVFAGRAHQWQRCSAIDDDGGDSGDDENNNDDDGDNDGDAGKGVHKKVKEDQEPATAAPGPMFSFTWVRAAIIVVYHVVEFLALLSSLSGAAAHT